MITDPEVLRVYMQTVNSSSLSTEEKVNSFNSYLALRGQSYPNQDELRLAASTGVSSITVPQTSGGTITVNGDGTIEGEDPNNPDIVVNGRRGYVDADNHRDHRVRISAFLGQEEQIYGAQEKTNLLYPLHATDGLLFPYTPTISMSQDTSWQTTDLEHANYDILTFQKSSSAALTLSARFTVQNQREGEYTMAAIHFLRTVSKSYFGVKQADKFEEINGKTTPVNGKSGTPPPILLFSGYGSLLFNNLRVVVRNHSWSFDESSDMVRVELPIGGSVWLPPVLQISIGLGIQMNTDSLRENFSLDEFRTGALLKSTKKGWF